MGGLGTTYDDNLGLIGKRVVDFLLVLIVLFSLGVIGEALRANIGSNGRFRSKRGPADPKFQVEGVDPTNHSFSSWYKSLDRFFFCFVTIHAFDRQTDKQTDVQLFSH